MDLPVAQLGLAAEVVDVVRVAAVDDRVAFGLEVRRELADDGVDDSRRDHEPDGARRVELLHELLERLRRATSTFGSYVLTSWPAAAQALGHVRAHPAQSDHSELHLEILQLDAGDAAAARLERLEVALGLRADEPTEAERLAGDRQLLAFVVDDLEEEAGVRAALVELARSSGGSAGRSRA